MCMVISLRAASKILILSTFGMVASFMLPVQAAAETYTCEHEIAVPGSAGEVVTWMLVSDKDTYAPGEDMILELEGDPTYNPTLDPQALAAWVTGWPFSLVPGYSIVVPASVEPGLNYIQFTSEVVLPYSEYFHNFHNCNFPYTVVYPDPTGEISATDCEITAGNSTCETTVTWSSTNTVAPRTIRIDDEQVGGNRVETNLTGVDFTVSYGDHTVQLLHDDGFLNDVVMNATCAQGLYWSAGVCAEPTGAIEVSPCFIAFNESTCINEVAWSSINTSPAHSMRQEGVEFSTASAESMSRTFNYGENNFSFYHDSGEELLDSVTVMVGCTPGTNLTWNSETDLCEIAPPAPESDFYAEAVLGLIRSGNSAEISLLVAAEHDLECEVLNADTDPIYITHAANPIVQEYEVTTRVLTSAQIVSLTCTSPVFPALPPVTDEVRVEVVPTVQEM